MIISTEHTLSIITRYSLVKKAHRQTPTANNNCTVMMKGLRDIYETHEDVVVGSNVFELMRYIRNTGVLVSVVPSGMVADKYGPKTIILVGLVMFSLTSFLNPTLLLRLGTYPFFAGNFTQGLFKGMIYPGITVALAQWAPSTERATVVGIKEASKVTGNVLGYLLCASVLRNGWTAKYYFAGFAHLLWSLFWYLFFCNGPKNCPHITSNERNYILKRTKELKGEADPLCSSYLWLNMLRSLPFLSLIFTYMAANWIYVTARHLIEESYTQNILQMTTPLTEYCTLWISSCFIFPSIFWSAVSDWMINNNVTTRTLSRKVLSFLGVILPLPFLYLVFLANCNNLLVLMLLMCSSYMRGFLGGSLYCIPIDLSPRHAGLVQSKFLFISYFIRSVAFTTFEFLCGKENDPACYFLFLNLTTVTAVVASSLFLWLGSAEVQPWNWGPNSQKQQSQDSSEGSET